jgi:formyltetrahydrofolate-dependent phosphoribosylglycinamide formyltransferase
MLSEPLDRPLRLGVMISGGGTTLKNLVAEKNAGRLPIDDPYVIASREDCGGVAWAREQGFQVDVIARKNYPDTESFSDAIFKALRAADVDLITNAGFLSLIYIPDDYFGRVLNIHPSLIPSFCGKGYYGHKVHQAALERGVKISGCTVHFSDNEYDNGPIILQRAVPVEDDDTPESLAARVFEQECIAYPEAIRLYAQARLKIEGRRVRILPE